MLLRLNGQNLTNLPQDLAGLKPGQKVRLEVRRKSRTLSLKFDLGAKQETQYRISELPDANPEQLRVRNGWLEGKP